MATKPLSVIGLVIIVLFGVFAIPTITEHTGDIEDSVEITTGDTHTISDSLEMRLESTNTTAEEATVTLSDTQTLENTTKTIPLNSTVTYQFTGGDIQVALTAVSSSSATLDVTYPSTYGWDNGASVIASNLPLILVIVLFVSIMGIGVKGI